ncbi:MocR-like pyridoxine biosynthesis transcription factor PdxR [Antrihabitans cavernicola]|uniref:PLP-dependent aminotransferase family protein n=1 Tax=Antrihabitans cavernicola TaxID=2495913 RepID=A0A5A7SF15_9NOCA|nr:PLP-dependent aminotransferase family protein [Spelaeibacter cavernicola]KAA0023752.1 PLP-dependent aminotransferase family protein [Spelaeibacter cavernicola]
MSADELPVVIDRTSPIPLAVQVARALRDAATHGGVRTGDRLPSSRALATRLGVSRTVTAAAYDQLHSEGWIAGRHGSGTYVTAAPARVLSGFDVARSDPALPERIDLVARTPSIDAIDPAAWRRAWRAAADRPPERRPQRGGIPEYRAAVAEHLLRHRGLVAGDSVLASAGTSSATGELAMAVLAPGDLVAVENPGYGRAVGALTAAGMRVLPVPVDGDGLCIDAIPDGVRAVFCTPAHQFPMGARMPAGRRVALIERARRDGWLIIEDDYDSELRYDSAPLPLLAALGPDVVAHLGTTSKILTPTLGVGWLAAPAEVIDAVLAHRSRTGTGPAIAGQAILAEFARGGDLARHLRRIRRQVAVRRATVVDALRAASISVIGDDAGAHVVIPLPSATAEDDVVERGADLGLSLDGLARHFHSSPPYRHGIALGYTACSSIELASAMPPVAALVRSRT